MLANSGRIIETDKKFGVDVRDQSFANYLFVRLVAKGRTFTNVDFRYSMFDASYLRKCKFDSCNFTGCRFVSTNLFESTFIGCTFDYVVFERTFVDPEILETGCPGLENMKMRFARTLRMNYQQIGDAKAANAAMNVELQATAAHLTKAWRSNESYYRKKYTGWRRAKVFGQWIDFKVLDFVWGNGESLGKLLRAVLAVLVSISLIDVWLTGDGKLVGSYVTSMERAPQLFLGTMTPAAYPAWYVAVILFLRLVAVSFFVTIVIKRFSRR